MVLALAYYPVKLDAEGKIVGGQDVDITQLPFTLSLERNGAVHVCGASIISQSFALTAAHCVDRYSHTNDGKNDVKY